MIDHLVYGAPLLEEGMDRVEALLGVRPVVGGRHPDFGTHNALLSLGPSTYLEVIAPDPGLPRPARGLVFGMNDVAEPGLVTWAVRREDIQQAGEVAAGAGLHLGEIQEGSRLRSDGVRLSWRLTDPYAMPRGGVVPFLIAWGETPHPAASAPPAGALVGLVVGHPEPDAVRKGLDVIGADAEVVRAPRPRLTARISTTGGVVEL